MILDSTRDAVLNRRVDLQGLSSLLNYATLGISSAKEFSILKGAPPLPKPEVDAFRETLFSILAGKPKDYIRPRIPLLLIGLVDFEERRLRGEPLEKRLLQLKNYVKAVDSQLLSAKEVESLHTTLSEGFAKPHYSEYLDSKVDPFAPFFEGKAPGSFTKAVEEATQLIAKNAGPEILVVEEPGRDLRVIEDKDPPTLTVVEDPIPNVTIVDRTDDRTVVKSASRKGTHNLVYAAAGLALGLGLGYIARAAIKK